MTRTAEIDAPGAKVSMLRDAAVFKKSRCSVPDME